MLVIWIYELCDLLPIPEWKSHAEFHRKWNANDTKKKTTFFVFWKGYYRLLVVICLEHWVEKCPVLWLVLYNLDAFFFFCRYLLNAMSKGAEKYMLTTTIDNVISGSPKGVSSILNFLSENFQDAYKVWVVFVEQLSPPVTCKKPHMCTPPPTHTCMHPHTHIYIYMYTVEFL